MLLEEGIRMDWQIFSIFISIVDDWMFINNSGEPYQIIAEGSSDDLEITNNELWKKLKKDYYGK